MITLTMQCFRCSKEISHDMTNRTLGNDLIREFGFNYAHNGKTNILLCSQCEKLLGDLQEKLDNYTTKEMCSFFGNCTEEKGNGHKGKPKNGRS